MNKLLCRLWGFALQPRAIPWVVLGSGFWLGFLAWVRQLHLPDEGRYVGVAYDMLRSDSFWVPLLNGMPYFHKPPLFYWLNEIAFMVFGVHEWSARLPSVLAAWFSALALYFFMRKHRGVEQATLALVVLVTMPYFYGGAQYANLDMLVAGMISLTVIAGAEAVLRSLAGEPYRMMSLGAAACAALALLSKGLIGLVLPGGVLFFWLVLTGRWRKLGVLLWPAAILMFLVVAVPWFWYMQHKFPDFFDYYFVHQQFERFVGQSFNNPQPIWFYAPVLLGMTLPWSFVLPWLFKPDFWKKDGSELKFLMLIWILIITVFFSIPASKLIGYTLPALAPMAALIAEVLYRGIHGAKGSTTMRLIGGFVVASVIVCLISIGIFRFIQSDSAQETGQRISAEFKPEDTMVYLMNYPFDLAFYADSKKPAWVVENWPGLTKRDNWRNELADAAQFDPVTGKQTLINIDGLLPGMCKTDNQVFWIRGDHQMPIYWDILKEREPFFVQQNQGTTWKIVTDAKFKTKFCQAG